MSCKIPIVIFLFYFLSEIRGGPVEVQPKYNDILPQIVGGVDAPPGYAKHMVALVFGEFIRWVSCGGSIISIRHILSAAHCIDPFVLAGRLNPSLRGSIGSNYWKSTQYMVNFRTFINHPEWNPVTVKNDITVLITTKNIVFNDVIGHVALNYDHVDRNLDSFVTGWGDPKDVWGLGLIFSDPSSKVSLVPSSGPSSFLGAVPKHPLFGQTPDRLQLLYTPTITSDQCEQDVQNATNHFGSSIRLDPTLEICALHSYGHGMCHGDSGSALVSVNPREQIGVVSWGFPCARGAPDMFARISPYSDWLDDILMNY